MKRVSTIFNILVSLFIGVTALQAQEGKIRKEFRPVAIAHGIDKPEGLAVIGNDLYISRFHASGSIIKFDLATKTPSGNVAEGLNYPSGLLAFQDKLIVLEYGTGSLFLVDPKSGQKELVATGFSRPVDVVLFNDQLYVSDFGRGAVYQVNPETWQTSEFATGLAAPAGLAVFKDQLHVAEWSMGRISRILKDGSREVLVSGDLSSPWGLMAYGNELYVAETGSNEISRITAVKVPVRNRLETASEQGGDVFKDSVTVYKVAAVGNSGLDHPEAFCVSERGIYVSEWKSKEVSEIRLNSPPAGELALTGKPKLGYMVKAEPQNIRDDDGLGPFAYRWQIADRPAAEQWTYLEGRKDEYKPKRENLVGRYLRAELSYTDQGGYEEYVFSDAVLITEPFAPEVVLSFLPESILQPGDTVTLVAEIQVLDEDAAPDKVEFTVNGQPLMTLAGPPYRYRFVVQDTKTEDGYIDPFSITARGFDTHGLYGEDQGTVYVTNEEIWKGELQSLFLSSQAGLRLFPNPAKDILNVVHNLEGPVRVRLIDMNNIVVKDAVVNQGTRTFDVSRLTPGTYIVEYTTGGETRAEIIIKL